MRRPSIRTLLLSITASLCLVPSARADEPAGVNYAFLVGCAKYDAKQLRPLNFTVNDVTDFAAVLKKSGWRDDHIVVMTDDQPRRYQPEAKKIRKELELLLAGAVADDTVVVALSGHGLQFQDEKESYFCPLDAQLDDKETLLSLSWVYDRLDQCKASRKLLLVDACRNDPLSAVGDKGVEKLKLVSKTRPQAKAVPKGIVALFSCSEGQESYEDPDLKHGVFFYQLLQGWEGKANPDGPVMLDDLVRYVRKETPTYARVRLGTEQVPTFKGEFSGQWSLKDRTSKPPARLALDLNDIADEKAASARVASLVTDAVHTRALLAEAAKMAKKKDQPFNINATIILARAAQEIGDADDAVFFYKITIDQAVQVKSPQKIGTGYAGLIRTLYDDGKYAECEQTCLDFLGIKGDATLQQMQPAVLRQLVLVKARQGKIDKAADLISRFSQAQPDSFLSQIAKAQFQREVDKPADAVKAYEAAIELVKKDKDYTKEEQDSLVNDIRYKLSGLHLEMNDVKSATADLQALLEKDPNNPSYNNDLGYIWADHDMNLPESERMIRKALDEDRKQKLKVNPDLKPEEVKDCPNYLDSLGWVLYKEKKYKEARAPLEQAIKYPDGQDIDNYNQLAEVLMALGDKQGAVAAWKKGLELPAGTKREKEKKAEVEKKLRANA